VEGLSVITAKQRKAKAKEKEKEQITEGLRADGKE
jgi:hypothetical protein